MWQQLLSNISNRTRWAVSLTAVIILTIPASVFAVRPNDFSFSSEMATAQRAVAAMHPDNKLRNPDYLAEKFVSDGFWYYYHYSRDYPTSMKFVKTFRIGSYYYVNARTKHIDKLLHAAGRDGVVQVVILGAGFDSRAYRLEKALSNARFFELDHPPTIMQKQKMVKNIFGKAPSHVTYVPLDYNLWNIAEALNKTTYDPKKKTFFIWEAVTYFLSSKAIDQTLQFIATQSAAGSSVVFDYLPEPAIKEKAKKYQSIRRMAFRMALAGEPLRSGLPEAVNAANGFIKARGLNVLSNIGAEKLTQSYLMGSDGKPDGQPSQHYRIVHAQVASQ